MKIKDILEITGGRTNILIYAIENEKYHLVHKSIVDEIDFSHVPYGEYEVKHLTVVNGTDDLQLHFDYPELSEETSDHIGKFMLDFLAYPTEIGDKLFIKYCDYEYIRYLLETKPKKDIYNEIQYKS